MSDFHYVRTLGSDGGVDACSGPAIGLDLESVLADGLPPYKVALQIIAGLCEVLDISEEDGEVHGDIDPKYVFIDDTGAISLEAFGQSRSRAPENRPKGAVTDLYGLGYVAFRLFSFAPLPKLSRDDPNDHDDAVIDAILGIRFEGLNEEMVGDVQWFMAKLLSFEREERPTAVETWRTFLAYAEEARGPDFVDWCLDALDRKGERRTLEGMGPVTQPTTDATDDLRGPLVSQGPLAAGGLSFGSGTPQASGTAFFTKDEMKAALENDRRDADQFRPAPGGGSATNYWSRDQLKAMAKNEAEAPRPKRAAGEGEKRKTLALSKKDLDAAQARPRTSGTSRGSVATAPRSTPAPVPLADQSFASHNSFDQPEPTVRMNAKAVRTMTPAPAPQVFRPPGLKQPVSQQPVPGRPQRSHSHAPVPVAPPPPPAQEELPEIGSAVGAIVGEATVVQSQDEVAAALAHERARVQASMPPHPAPEYLPPEHATEDGGINVMIIAGLAMVIVVAIISCAGLGGISAFVALVSGGAGSGSASVDVAPAPTPELPLKTVGDGVAAADPSPEPTKPTPRPTEPTPRPTKPTPRPTKPTPRPTRPTPRPTRPTPRPAPAPVPAPVVVPPPTPDPAPLPTGPVTLTLRTGDRGKLMCPGVGNKPFDGNMSMNIDNYALPATCLVIIDGARESFQVFGTGMVKCNKRGDSISCSSRTVGK